MKLPAKQQFLLRFILIASLVIAGFLAMPMIAHAQKDTASSNDVQFTSIPTAADSIAMRKAQEHVKAAASQSQAITDQVSAIAAKQDKINSDKPKTLWGVFWAGLVGGFLAILMPCIYPLLPLTVSFFTKKAGSQSKGILNSFIYGLSIIVIYVGLGMLISIIFGSDALNALSTNGVFNLFFFGLLVVFGISFLGAFEITLPSSLANKLNANSDRGGLSGIFFMAATLVVVSFSCTGPIIGTLLVDAASKGDRLGPAIGMLGFSTALALPFTAFALFPSALKSLPKSGGWLNSVKVILGFLELAFALKFLSNVDLAYHWNWFDREIFLSLWIAIGLMMGLYLIGKIRFSHDSDVPFLTIPRTFLSIVVFAFVIYMIPGLWGAPLKSISAFLPPLSTQDFDLSSGVGAIAAPNQTGVEIKKYGDVFRRLPKVKGVDDWYDYDQAMAIAKQQHKPLLIDFTGWNCVNCRKMEQNVLPNPGVLALLQNDFVVVQLVVDDKTDLATADRFTSTYSGKHITTIGGKWSDFEASKFDANSQPYYVMLDNNGKILVPPQGADYDVNSFVAYLQSGIMAYKSK
jgi:thiol:disulfide interchange protein